MRKGIKFVPTPRTPIDLKRHLKDFEYFRESMRWAYFFAKKTGFKVVNNTFEHKPWYQKTQRKAPLASAGVEAFLNACASDILDENLRRRIKDNLTLDERNALKNICSSFPKLNLSISKEDKGSPFVIMDTTGDKSAILEQLNDPVQYEKI